MDTSRGFLSGTVDKFKMVSISMSLSADQLPLALFVILNKNFT
jgi:hypothetical protein